MSRRVFDFLNVKNNSVIICSSLTLSREMRIVDCWDCFSIQQGHITVFSIWLATMICLMFWMFNGVKIHNESSQSVSSDFDVSIDNELLTNETDSSSFVGAKFVWYDELIIETAFL